MASLSRVNVQIGFDGQGAISGMGRMEEYLRRISSALESTGKKAEETNKKVSGGGGSGSGGGFFTEIAAGGFLAVSAVKGIYSLVSGFVDLGSQMESLTARSAMLAGSWEKARSSLGFLREVSIRSGISFGELAKAFGDIQEAGFSADASAGTVSQFSRAAEALGSGGMAFLTGAYKSLMSQTMATTQTIDELEAKGLPVYQSLAANLSVVSGRAMTAAEAMQAVKDQTVLASQAAQALKDAAQAPAVLEAQRRMENTLQGQLMRAKTSMEEMSRSIAESFFKAFDFSALVAGARGAFMAILRIVQHIAESFGPLIDPKDKGSKLESIFKAVRDMTVNLAETMAKGGLQLKFFIDDAVAALELMATKFEISLREGLAGQISGKTKRLQREAEIAQELRLGRPEDIATIRANQLADLGAEFEKIRDRVARDDRFGEFNRKGKADNLAARMQEAAKSVDGFIQSVNAGKSPLQMFEQELTVAQNVMAEAAVAGLKGDKLAAAQDAVNKRIAAAGANLIKAMQVSSDSWKAPRSDVGTAAAVEDSLRNRFGMPAAADMQQQIKAALDEANRLKEQDLNNQRQMIDAIKNARPAVAAFVN